MISHLIIEEMKDACASELKKDLKNLKSSKREIGAINCFTSDAKVGLNDSQGYEWLATQGKIGFEKVFKGWVIKNLFNVHKE